jgi:DNA-binding LacI/PurR family transcriptional regulator
VDRIREQIMPVTLKDIADHTGLSCPTVTRILRGDSARFSKLTRDRVQKAAAELGYRPNAAARAVGRGRFGCVTLLLGSDIARSDMPVPLLLGMQDELARHDMYLAVTRLPDEELTRDGVVPKVLRENMSDGLIVNYTHNIPQRMRELIESSSVPAVWVNVDLPANCVHPADSTVAAGLVERLYAAGHRRIAYFKFDSSEHYSVQARREGYIKAMRQRSLEPILIDRETPTPRQPDVVREVLSRPDRPTAGIVRPEDAPTIVCVAAELGLSFPRDLSMASISGYKFSLMGREVTASILPAHAEGREAVAMLLRRLAKPGERQSPVVTPFEVFEGQTITSPPPGERRRAR